MDSVVIRSAAPADSAAITRIYNEYIRSTAVTFEEEPVTSDEIEGRMKQISGEGLPWLVTERAGNVVGYAYAGKWKNRSAYRFSVESTVYLDRSFAGHGLGSLLYGDLLGRLRGARVHVVVGVIALPNATSVALHEKFGFEKVAHFTEVGFKFDQWIDVGYWQLTFRG